MSVGGGGGTDILGNEKLVNVAERPGGGGLAAAGVRLVDGPETGSLKSITSRRPPCFALCCNLALSNSLKSGFRSSGDRSKKVSLVADRGPLGGVRGWPVVVLAVVGGGSPPALDAILSRRGREDEADDGGDLSR
jgi:hypothetical protein